MDIYLTDIYIFILIYFYITSDLFKDIWLIAQKYFTEVGQDQKKKSWQPPVWKIRPSCILIMSLDLEKPQMLGLARIYNIFFIEERKFSGKKRAGPGIRRGQKSEQARHVKWADFIFLPWSSPLLKALVPQSHRKPCVSTLQAQAKLAWWRWGRHST